MRIHTGWLFFATNSVGSKYLQGKAAISGRTKTTGDDVPSRGCSIPCSLQVTDTILLSSIGQKSVGVKTESK